jgi:hypothetical protein
VQRALGSIGLLEWMDFRAQVISALEVVGDAQPPRGVAF